MSGRRTLYLPIKHYFANNGRNDVFLIEPTLKRIRHPWHGDVEGAIYELRSLMGELMKEFFKERLRDLIWITLTVWVPIILTFMFCIFVSRFWPGYEWGATASFIVVIAVIDFIIIKKYWK